MQGLDTIPTLELKKVRLRPIREADAPALYAYYSQKAVHQYLNWYGPASVEDAARIIHLWQAMFEEGRLLRMGIADKETDALIGTIFLGAIEGRRADIGYELSPEYWGRGIMPEAIEAMVRIGFDALNLARVQALVHLANINSAISLEKTGFEREGLLRAYETHVATGEVWDMFIYARISPNADSRGY